MAELLGPDFFNLQVRDLSASRAFYTEVLGLTEDTSFTAPGVVLFDSTTTPFTLSSPNVNPERDPPSWMGGLALD
jgi:catechol 2,3-dioxygenase-like lactoylglutathione lyase family enzyme